MIVQQWFKFNCNFINRCMIVKMKEQKDIKIVY